MFIDPLDPNKNGDFKLKEALAHIEALENNKASLQSDNKRLQEEISSATSLSLGIETISEGVLILNSAFEVSYMNAAYGRLTGIDFAEILGEAHPGTQRFFDSHKQETLDIIQDGQSWLGTITIERSGNADIIAEQSINPTFDDQGLNAYVIITRDITEEVKMELDLRQAQKLESIGQLAAGIAHEINTPTQYLSDNLQFIFDAWQEAQAIFSKYQREFGKDEIWIESDMEFIQKEILEAFSHASEGVEQIRKIVLSMKNFAHPGAKDMEPSNINQAIRDVINIANSEYKHIAEIELLMNDALPDVYCMRSEINQVLLNMIINAAQSIAELNLNKKGRIQISTHLVDARVKIKISDSGAGMDNKTRERIFDPFFTTKAVGKGSGQGLAIAFRVVVDNHGGTIDVDSELGKGTTFTISLPLKPATKEQALLK